MIDRRANLSGEEFRRDYLQTKTPVLLEHLADDWPARSKWSKAYLQSVCGEQIVEVMGERDSDPLFEMQCEQHRRQMRFSDFVDLAFSETYSNNVYMVANNQFMLTDGGRSLLADVVQSPDYCHVHDVNGRIFLWFGPGGTITPLHYDVVDIILTQVRGSKRFRLFSPDQTPLLYNTIGVFSDVDYERPDLNKYPLFRYAQPVEFDLHPGEMIFLPEGHWHQVRSLEPSISVSFTNMIR